MFSESAEPLLVPKLLLPRLYTSLVERPRLLALLDAGMERKLTLVSAPAGFGKTTLVRQWIADRSTHQHLPPVAWVSLDAGDNDPVRFWRYVITACQTFQPDLGQPALVQLSPSLQPPFEPSPLEAVLTSFLNALTDINSNIRHSEYSGILVLEDYHVITSPQISEAVAFVLDHLPPSLHLMMITRSEPPLPLARLRARGDLCEIHTPDLRFSQEEMADFLQHFLALTPSILSEETLHRLETRLEGWAAGLRMLALSLQGHSSQKEVEQRLATLAGSHRPILDYFVTEVLDTQPEYLQRFLLQTSLLIRLTGPLCDAATGRQDSVSHLDVLERANLFLERLDGPGQWYRYHSLFAEAMQHEARHRLGEDALQALSQRAIWWYEQQGLLSEAIEMALKAGDKTRGAELIERLIETQHFDIIYEFHTLCRWLEQVPTEIVYARPLLCLGYARALGYSSGPDQPDPTTLIRIEELLKIAEQGVKGNDPKLGEVFSFRSLVAFRQGKQEQAVTFARQALALLPEKEPMWRSVSLQFVGAGELLAGQFNAARKTFQEARALWETIDNIHGKRSNTIILATVCTGQGELHLAAEYYRQALAQARKVGDRSDIALAQLGLAQLFYEWNELDAAWCSAQEASDLGAQLREETLHVQAALTLVQVSYAQGHISQAQQRLATLLAQLPAGSQHQSLHQEVLIGQARLQLATGDLSAMQRSLTTLAQYSENLPQSLYEQKELLVARLLLAQGKANAALDILIRLLEAAREAGRVRVSLETQLLMAIAYSSQHASRQVQEARRYLQTVLTFAHTEGYLRIFLDEGDAIATLLRPLISHLREKPVIAYARALLQAFDEQRSEAPASASRVSSGYIEPLSVQEQRVLRLLVADRSYPEIARELVVSVNTIKTQVSSIYRKLNVSNRREASEVARHRKLL